MAHRVKVLAAKLEDLSLILGTHAKVGSKNKLGEAVFCLPHVHRDMCPHVYIK